MGWVQALLAILPGIVKLLNNIFGLFKKSTTVKVDEAQIKVKDRIDEQLEQARNRK